MQWESSVIGGVNEVGFFFEHLKNGVGVVFLDGIEKSFHYRPARKWLGANCRASFTDKQAE
jgi:hypothetical protein